MEQTSQQVASELDMDNLRRASSPVAIDDDLDLSIDRDGEVWEEWIEDQDFMAASVVVQPSLVTIPSWEEYTIRRQLNPIEVKPTIPRSTPEATNDSAQWNKFAPEHIGIVANAQSQIYNSNNSHQLDQLIADLDI